MRALAYLRGTTELGISWRNPGGHSRNTLQCFVDSDYAACVDTRRSQTGYVVTLRTHIVEGEKTAQRYDVELRGGILFGFRCRQGD
mmetsp:Transcript_29902/g.46898  ORF Transcript_29902/g.46898 Transcript_29902/m.46898 type:complete len:86 (+) Transcript_29902:116-373(+)